MVLVGIAALNDAEAIEKFVPLIPKKFQKETIDVLVVDDGSIDHTPDVAEKMGAIVLKLPAKDFIGNGRARKAVLSYAIKGNYRWIITMDGDGQHSPQIIPKIIQKLYQGYDFVRASRFHPQSQKNHLPPGWLFWNQKITSEINRITNWNLTDALCGMMGFPTAVAQRILPHLEYDCYGYAVEILLKLYFLFPDLKVTEVPHPAIYEGTSKLKQYQNPQFLQKRKQRFMLHLEQIKELEKQLFSK